MEYVPFFLRSLDTLTLPPLLFLILITEDEDDDDGVPTGAHLSYVERCISSFPRAGITKESAIQYNFHSNQNVSKIFI